MSSPWPRPLVTRWTTEQFQEMGGRGWFEGRRPFLLDGVIWEQGMMDPPHAVALELIYEALRPGFRPGCMVRQQMPLNVDEYTDPVPDVAVVPGAPRDYSDAHPVTAVLVVEVSDTTLPFDLTEKAERYATAGVADYWVLDLDGRRLLVLRDPQPLPKGLGATAYRTELALGPADRVSPLAAPHAAVLVADLLP
jgi:Uma2 family endonuclease